MGFHACSDLAPLEHRAARVWWRAALAHHPRSLSVERGVWTHRMVACGCCRVVVVVTCGVIV